MPPSTKESDYDHIVARQKRYVEAYNSGSAERMMEFMDRESLVYSDFGATAEGLSHSKVEDLFRSTFDNVHDLKLETRSLHGDKSFTAWEWVITCKAALHPDGWRLKREEAPPKKLIGCTLMWWNDEDKITKNHDYTHERAVSDVEASEIRPIARAGKLKALL